MTNSLMLPIAEINDTSSFTYAVNSTKQGIGRIETLRGYLLINNIGCNFEFFPEYNGSAGGAFSDNNLVFAQTEFPGEDLASLLDLDAHSFFQVAGYPHFFASNHFGTIRAFDLESPAKIGKEVKPDFELQWFGDTERLMILDDWLISTSPRGHETSDPARPGLFVSERLSAVLNEQIDASSSNSYKNVRHRLRYHNHLTDWSFITGLTIDNTRSQAAVISDRRLGLFSVSASKAEEITSPLTFSAHWELELPFSGMWSQFNASGTRLYVAGSDVRLVEGNFDDWDTVSGGGLLCIDCLSGDVLFETDFSHPIAWGYGSVPLVLHSDEKYIYGVERFGGLIRLDCQNGTAERVYQQLPELETSLGLGHAAQLNDTIVAGFNRGGYRLFTYSINSQLW